MKFVFSLLLFSLLALSVVAHQVDLDSELDSEVALAQSASESQTEFELESESWNWPWTVTTRPAFDVAGTMKRIYANVMTINGVLKEMWNDGKLRTATSSEEEAKKFKVPDAGKKEAAELFALQKPYLDLIQPTYKLLNDDIANFEKAFGDWESFIVNGKPTPVDLTDFKKIQRDFASCIGITRPQPFHHLYYDDKKVLHLRGLPSFNSDTLVPNGGPTPPTAVDEIIGDIEADLVQLQVVADKMDRSRLNTQLQDYRKFCNEYHHDGLQSLKNHAESNSGNSRIAAGVEYYEEKVKMCSDMKQKVLAPYQPSLDAMHKLYVSWRTNWYKLWKMYHAAFNAHVSAQDPSQWKLAKAMNRLNAESHLAIYNDLHLKQKDHQTEEIMHGMNAGGPGNSFPFNFHHQ